MNNNPFIDDDAIRTRLSLLPKTRRIINTLMSAYDRKDVAYLVAVKKLDQSRSNGGELAEIMRLMLGDLRSVSHE